MSNDQIVRLDFSELISSNRYVTDALTPEMLQRIRERVYNDAYLAERVTEAVYDALETLYPELVRETDDGGRSKVVVKLEIKDLRNHAHYMEDITVMAEDLSSGEDAGLWQWKYNHDWKDDDGEIHVISAEWADE